jgi:hypothetical protein
MQDKAKTLDQGQTGGGAGTTLCRLMWMFIGPLSLMIIGYQTVAHGDGWLAFRDVVCTITLALIIGGKWLELRSGKAETATGEPATIVHFKRYVMILLPLTAVLWIAAKIVGNHVLRGG